MPASRRTGLDDHVHTLGCQRICQTGVTATNGWPCSDDVDEWQDRTLIGGKQGPRLRDHGGCSDRIVANAPLTDEGSAPIGGGLNPMRVVVRWAAASGRDSRYLQLDVQPRALPS